MQKNFKKILHYAKMYVIIYLGGDNMTNQEIGKRMRETRIEKGLKLTEIGELLSVSPSTVQRYELGAIGEVKIPVLLAIADVLGVNPQWLLGNSEDKYLSQEQELGLTLKEKKLVQAFRKQPDMQKAVLRLLKLEED